MNPRRPLLLAIVVLPLVAALGHARRELTEADAFRRSARAVHVKPPLTPPEVSQASVDIALVMFGIEVPASAQHPLLDESLKDRGLTSRGAFMDKAEVTVGPAAFSSWSLLGSTLAHELEVHCNQSFLFIGLMDLFGLDGTAEAERQAYAHELRNAKRFALDVADAELIADTVEYYYPDDPSARAGVPRVVRRWLARNLLTGFRGL